MPSQIIQVPFTGGVKQSVASEFVDPTQSILDVVNGVYARDGGVDKRLGVAALTSGQIDPAPMMGTPVRLVSTDASVSASDGNGLWSYVGGSSPGWAYQGRVPSCQATRDAAVSVPPENNLVAYAEGPDRQAFAYRTGASGAGTVSLIIRETASGTIVHSEHNAAASATSPSIAYASGYFVLLWVASGTTLTGSVYTANGILVTNSVSIEADMFASIYDVTPEAGGTGLLVAYAKSTPTASSSPTYIRLESLPALTVTGKTTLALYNGTTTTMIACRYDGTLGVVWFYWEANTSGSFALWAQVFDLTWSSVASPFSLSGMLNYSGSAQMIAIEPTSALGTAANTVATVFSSQNLTVQGVAVTAVAQVAVSADGTSVTTGAQAVYPSCKLYAKPFRASVAGVTRCYLPVIMWESGVGPGQGASLPTTASVLLMDTVSVGATNATGAVVPVAACVVAPRQVSTVATNYVLNDMQLTSPSGIGSTTAGSYRVVVPAESGEEWGQGYVANVAQFDFTQALSLAAADADGEPFLSGGITSCHPPGSVCEASFLSWPVLLTQASDNSAGSLTPGAQYQFAICWSQVDSAGMIHRSAFWSSTITLGGSDTEIVLKVQTIPFTSRSSVTLEVYRTQANQTTLYFDGFLAANLAVGSYATALSYAITQSDASIATNALQPTTGGALDSVCPPSSPCGILKHLDRLWLIDDTQQNIWYSSTFTDADATLFNEALTLPVASGPLTALASMDDKLVVFSATSIRYVEGYGPPITGIGSDLTTAVPVPSDTGSGDWRSIVTVVGVGVFFQSGLNSLPYLLDRGLGVTCIGKQVQDWFPPGTVVLSAAQVPLTTQIRFVLSTGYVVTYDYGQTGPTGAPGRWARSLYPSAPSSSVVPLGGPWTFAGADGYVYQELSPASSAPCFDTAGGGQPQWITTTVRMADYKMGSGLQSSMQLDFVQPIARFLDPCDVTTRLVYDFGSTSDAAKTYHYSDLVKQSASIPAWRASPSPMYAQPMSVSVVLSDAPPTGGVASTGRGVRWLGLALSSSSIGSVYDKLVNAVKQ